MKKIIKIIIVFIFVFVISIFYISLTRDTNYNTSSLINKETPEFKIISFDNLNFYTRDDIKKNNYTLINFWATDCPGCINEMPGLIETYNQYKDQGLEVIAVAMYYDPPSRVISFTKNNNLPFPVVLDTNKEIISKFNNVKLTPTSIILDENGYVINTIIGEIDFNEFNKKLIKLLK